eukprot:GHVO01044224.1.p1 GENE.GHVO01044224.1~~GHVO01044224.1.p1  ORF type:complete len:110 (+),score=8.77 GHVO01044224.1:16-345(+)
MVWIVKACSTDDVFLFRIEFLNYANLCIRLEKEFGEFKKITYHDGEDDLTVSVGTFGDILNFCSDDFKKTRWDVFCTDSEAHVRLRVHMEKDNVKKEIRCVTKMKWRTP